jgi:Holliday junction resolvasome RuvABC endonuclease subunit
MLIIGVDPGKNGAAATLSDGELVEVLPFNGKIELCRTININLPDLYVIEKVTASPHMGVVSAFTFGKWAEVVETTAILTGRPVRMVRPQVWQNAIGVYSQGDKNRLYERAKELFPKEYSEKMFNKETSDAVLLAYYGWRSLQYTEER